MNPAIAANQQRLFLGFLQEIRPYLRRDSSLPRRLKDFFAYNRAMGSRDRKLYRELVYTAVRFLPWIEPVLDVDPPLAAKIVAWLAPELKPTSAYRAAHAGDWPQLPDAVAAKAAFLTAHSGRTFLPAELLPAWFAEHCPAAFTGPQLDALNRRASVWVRLQCQDHELVLDEFRRQNWAFRVEPDFPSAVCLPPNAEVAGSDAYRRGFVEIQDLGSQLILAHAPVNPGEHWLDACAGAGGKSLQLARLVGPSGTVDAADIRPEILAELVDRARRARLENIQVPVTLQSSYDGILVDAPCSGSGTWRRQPHLKWHLTPAMIAQFAATQQEILALNAPRVRPGGVLVYATCSLSHHENHEVAAAFLAAHADFVHVPPTADFGGVSDGLGTRILPGVRDTDGFYVAVFRRSV